MELTGHHQAVFINRRCPLTAVSLLALLALLALAPPLLAEDDPATADQAAAAEELRPDRPSFFVRAELDKPNGVYREGDSLGLRVVSEIDAYVYVLYEQVDGKTYQIFPNDAQPDNRLLARQAVAIPAKSDEFRLRVGPPFGKERLRIIASLEPIDALQQAELRKDLFNRVTSGHLEGARRQLKGIGLELGEEKPIAWAEHSLELTTTPKSQPVLPSEGKRFALFVGIADHQFATLDELITEKNMNLPTCHRDARRLAEVLHASGELDDYRILTNEQGTRQNIEQAITRWLPQQSKPGDLVLLYISGHGMQWPDDNGDESDGQDEFIIPHDFLSIGAMTALLKPENAASIPPELRGLRNQVAQAVRTHGAQKVAATLVRNTAISDDVFAQWLQGLAGRQVVVLLDSCHSGGFATLEKAFDKSKSAVPFDFLESEVGRLKDLGHRDTALFATCHRGEAVSVPGAGKLDERLSLMTYFLVKQLEAASTTVELQDAHRFVTQGMTDYYRQHGEPAILPAPLVNNCTRPVVLKP
jgi:hypothetical protein